MAKYTKPYGKIQLCASPEYDTNLCGESARYRTVTVKPNLGSAKIQHPFTFSEPD